MSVRRGIPDHRKRSGMLDGSECNQLRVIKFHWMDKWAGGYKLNCLPSVWGLSPESEGDQRNSLSVYLPIWLIELDSGGQHWIMIAVLLLLWLKSFTVLSSIQLTNGSSLFWDGHNDGKYLDPSRGRNQIQHWRGRSAAALRAVHRKSTAQSGRLVI